MKSLKNFWNDESGAELTEYSLVIGVVALGVVAVLVIFRDKISGLFEKIGNGLDAAPANGQ
ncbi:MAG TPA: hypothetical protein VM100_13285 [Longimicrobiales bacterium]|nr:hypothetical protein [Longimicrobiales bacterium]